MFSALEWMVAFRYLRARRREGFISVIAWFSLLGIALGVATLIIVMGVMNGFREELLNRILGLNGHLGVYSQSSELTDYDPWTAKIKAVPGVRAAFPLIQGQVMATSKNAAGGAAVRGVRPADLKSRAIVADHIVSGSLANFSGPDAIVIGDKLARNMGVGVGGRITLISPKGQVTAFGTVPRMRAYTVVATFDVGMYEYDSSFIFMPLKAAQTYFRLPGAVTNIEVFINDPTRATHVAGAIAKALGGGVNIQDWQQANASFFNAVEVERNVMFLILTLIIVVAAFNIVSSLIMLVKDKGRDIAILRTMGATRGTIMRIFFIAGAGIGFIGTFAGLILGLAIATNIEQIRQWIQGLTGTQLFSSEIYFLSQLPSRVDPAEVVAVVAMGLGLSVLATIYPSWRAARIDPAEALRYE
ncbi:lipoprotein-releasing system permease protein [Varunaivibrio sulfuroxidans]|uniref:Lipoprotein-releasing system permease protein n=2 Tax=Varunaivibrio sulfuroxidans TaxID=1773489 RepID=A0A4R3JED7_9PROT|nr:lipoprotein-releasing system permease protein [Varunaivibrio sulfuroxidans]